MAHLAQINIGRVLAPPGDERLAEFMAQLDEVNALADNSPGFIWRLQSDSGNATDVVYNDDPLTLVNMSVWDSIENLKAFTYGQRHLSVFKDRAKWFEKPALPHYCLWWVPEGHIPTVREARERLEHYQKHGATPHSFWFSQWYPAPEAELVSV